MIHIALSLVHVKSQLSISITKDINLFKKKFNINIYFIFLGSIKWSTWNLFEFDEYDQMNV